MARLSWICRASRFDYMKTEITEGIKNIKSFGGTLLAIELAGKFGANKTKRK